MSPSYGFRRNFSSSHSVIAGKKRILRGCRDPRRNLNLALCLPAGHRVTPVPCLHLATASPFAGFLKIRRLVCLRLWCTLWWCGEKPLKCRLSQEEGRRQLRRPGGGATVSTPVTGRYYLPPVVVRTPPVHHHRCSSRMQLASSCSCRDSVKPRT